MFQESLGFLPKVMLGLITLIILTMIYIKVKFGFWADQPVFHVYNLTYMLWPPGIINHDLPLPNKYTNFKNIKTFSHDKLTAIQQTQMINFIQTHYLRNSDNIYSPKRENVIPYFESHNALCFFTLYRQNLLLHDTKTDKLVSDDELRGVITSRPIHVDINNQNKGAKFMAYYVDYLCVSKYQRKKGIAQQLIQTHEYNQRHLNNKDIVVSLFKREEDLTGIVPLCVYPTYGFKVTTWTKPFSLDAKYTSLEINPQNFNVLLDFIKLRSSDFDIVVYVEASNLMELVKTNNVYVHVILLDHQVVSAYFFRKSCTFVEKNMEVLSCFASINAPSNPEEVFIQGFKVNFWAIAEKHHFGFSAVENISHNNVIINNLLKKTHPLIKSPTAYFFYNFAYHTFNPEKCLILV